MTSSSHVTLRTDVLIVGGGPAGALLGSLLARQGVDVVLVEKQATSERTFRGETISASSVRSLFMLGYGPALEAHGYLEQTGIVMWERGRRVFSIDYRRLGDGYLPIDIPQPSLIEILLDDARRQPSFTMLTSTSISELIEADGAVRGAVVRSKGSEPIRITSRLVVGADGRFSRTRKLSALPATVTDMPRDFLWFRLPRPADWTSDGELAVSGNHNLVILPTFPDLLRVGYNLPKRGFSEIRERGRDAFVDSIAELDPRLGPLVARHIHSFADTSFLEIFTAYVPRWARDGLLLIGDAAHTTTPILGQGVNLALQDAVAVAHVVGGHLRATARGVVPAAALADVVAERRRHKRRVTALQTRQERSLALSGPTATRVRRVRMCVLDRLPAKYALLSRVLDPGTTAERDLQADALLTEAKRYVALHAGHMGVGAEAERALRGVTRLDGTGRASWVGELTALADRGRRSVQERADLLNLARFPCTDDDDRRAVAARASSLVADDLARRGAGTRMTAQVDGAEVPFLFRSAGRTSPLLIVMGGIVSLKEQWAPFLALGARAGCSVAVVDFPGAGENPLRYRRSAAQLFGAVMTAVQDLCASASTMVLAPSFGGHLALLAAGRDRRIRRLVTIDVPLREAFAGGDGHPLPGITRRALAHSCGVAVSELADTLPGLALAAEELRRVDIPVDVVTSTRDDVVPAGDARWARQHAVGFTLHPVDDEHGAPHHLRGVRLVAAAAVLEHAGRPVPRAVLRALTGVARLVGRWPAPVRSEGHRVPPGPDSDRGPDPDPDTPDPASHPTLAEGAHP